MPESDLERKRLTPIDRQKELIPFRRAANLEACALYWLPVKSFPAPPQQLEWLHAFLERWIAYLEEKQGLRMELFAQFKCLPLKDRIVNQSIEWMPLTGLSRRPGAEIPKIPDAKVLLEIMQPGGKVPDKFEPIDPTPFMPDYAYWMVMKYPEEQRKTLLGEGGLMLLFLPPSPETVPPALPISPEMAKRFGMEKQLKELEAQTKGAFALRDPFLEASKEVFGEGLERDIAFKGMPFIVPLLQTKDFFGNPKEEVEKWLELFPVYMRESPEDKGFLMASNIEFEEDLIETLRQMREEDLIYLEA